MSDRPPFTGFNTLKRTTESKNRAVTPFAIPLPPPVPLPTSRSMSAAPAANMYGSMWGKPAPITPGLMFGGSAPTASGSAFGTPAPMASRVLNQPSTRLYPRASSTPTLIPDVSDGDRPADAAVHHVDSELSLFAPSGPKTQASQGSSASAMVPESLHRKRQAWTPRQILESGPSPAGSQPRPMSEQASGQPFKNSRPTMTVRVPAACATTATLSNISQPVTTDNSSGAGLPGSLSTSTPTASNLSTAQMTPSQRAATVMNTTGSSSVIVIESNQASRPTPSAHPRVASTRPERLQMKLLEGPGVEITVGSELAFSSSHTRKRSWCLPEALVSHWSIVLRHACARPIFNSVQFCTTLPEDDPKIFELFVEWMYFGYYTLDSQITAIGERSASLDAQAWVLGHKLRSLQFKNYAMNRLYESVVCIAPKQIGPEDIKYACTNSAVGSKLRLFLFDYLNAHFANSFRIDGGTEEWDQVLLEHADARSCLLQGLRMGSGQRQTIRGKEAYLETEDEEEANHRLAKDEQVVRPGKRNADGVPVKNEPAET